MKLVQSDVLLDEFGSIEELRTALVDKLVETDPINICELLDQLVYVAGGTQEWEGQPSIRLLSQLALIGLKATCKECRRLEHIQTPERN